MRLPASALAASILVLAPLTVSAQTVEAELSAAGTAVEVRSVVNGNLETYRGFLAGLESRVSWDRLMLRVGYGQGPLDRTHVDFHGRAFVAGFARFDVRVIDGLALGVAGRARAYSAGTPSGPALIELALTGSQHADARRWLLWELHGSYARRVIPDLIGIYADGWWTRAGRINPGETYHGGRGGEVGLEARPEGVPLALRFGYAIDEIRIGAQGRRETVERVTLTLGYVFGGRAPETAAVRINPGR